MPEIVEGYHIGMIGAVTSLHARYYADLVGFGAEFEATVAGGMAEFVPRLDHPSNQIWALVDGDAILGSISIDGEDLDDGIAHLRWFIVDGTVRGGGWGRQLIEGALQFCDHQGFAQTHLWTFKGLDAARRLYEANGFALADEKAGDQWGKVVTEQKFVRPRGT